jgi:probable phosphomutase (TIGR03848 family)
MTALLIRHAETAAIGRYLAGRCAGLDLNDEGRRQAERLPARLSRYTVDAIYTSPLARARRTSEPLARQLGVDARVRADLSEVDFGAWTGMTFEQLQDRLDWQSFNGDRRSARAPGGERLSDVQARIVSALEDLAASHRLGTIVVVSHAEVIRCALLHYLAMPLDLFQRIEIAPASITALRVGDTGPTILSMNERD